MRVNIFPAFIFMLILTGCKSQTGNSSSTPLREELSEIYKNDQLYRAEMANVKPTDIRIVNLVHKQDSVDAINLKRVTTILDSMGFPGRKEFGDSAGLATFFVI